MLLCIHGGANVMNLKERRLELGLTLDEVGKLTGVGKSTVRKWETGYIENMGRDKIIKLSKALQISPLSILDPDNELLSDVKIKISETVNKLNADRQQNVYNYADNQLKEQNGKVVNLPLVGKSAANPTELTYGDVEIEHDDFTDVPHGADTAIRIQGDSMEPLIHDGQIIFYQQQEEVENGEIAIVEIDGDGVTCKQIYYDYTSDEVILRSINKKYEPRHVKDDQVRIIGRVIL
ncbi:phage repressor like XRE family transcriptional regulator [Lactiplantibacillus fabifermentans DSM 21115]|uniref:Phage repressor like XRE family transcriptional regulator n=3 Tax=Lactiplantibacillus TaxID=2767842 RepID=A0A0R2NRX9_9LACO|nr:phage repressor like XRE family transcriptional regulator [Lactiplantibacillus fabifermentans DSM 21115]